MLVNLPSDKDDSKMVIFKSEPENEDRDDDGYRDRYGDDGGGMKMMGMGMEMMQLFIRIKPNICGLLSKVHGHMKLWHLTGQA